MSTRKAKCTKTRCNKTLLNKNIATAMKIHSIDSKSMKEFARVLQKEAEEVYTDTTLSAKKRRNARKTYKNIQNAISSDSNIQSVRKRIIKEVIQSCKDIYCNPGCKGTIFEDGKELSKSLTKKWKNKSMMLEYLDSQHKWILGEKDSVLVNDFYEKLTPGRISYIKGKGAISGCLL